MAHVKLNLGLPGHKAVFWIMPVIAARLVGRCRAGATAGALAAALTSLGLGGHLAGGWLSLPLVGVAGILLDIVIGFGERRRLHPVGLIGLLGLAGMMANLLCMAKRLLAPVGPHAHYALGLPTVWLNPLSYAFFGFLAGLLGVVIAIVITRSDGRERRSVL